ncbi:MAG: hypothetical protein DRJ59_06625 [Thermoprotei archaeon]|nr:MAG: hypothetical protein DRJ59_06625 [Thermoprotei archaeon]
MGSKKTFLSALEGADIALIVPFIVTLMSVATLLALRRKVMPTGWLGRLSLIGKLRKTFGKHKMILRTNVGRVSLNEI